MANIGFISLGCAKNQVDCERMMYRVREAGHTVCPDVAGCDVVIINTCGFIDSAKAEAIDFILQTAQLKSQGYVGKILVTGCLSQRYQDEIIREMPEVDGILGTGSYTDVVAAVDALLAGAAVSKVLEALQALEGCPEDMEEKLTAFVQALLEKEILTAGETTDAGCAIDAGALTDGFALTVDAFDEVQDLILADPIHDVDVERGWPIMGE